MFRPSVLLLCAALLLSAGSPGAVLGAEQPPVRLLSKADALPLAIDPAFQFRKTKTFFLEDQQVTGIADPLNEEQSLAYERKRLLYGAVTPSDIRNRYGNYFTFFWRSLRPANLTVRLEYRQQKLGAFVQAREVDYPVARGSFATTFEVTGDDYLQQGRVSQWRVLLVDDHQAVVALGQSYLWR
jgi:hypothetical protein